MLKQKKPKTPPEIGMALARGPAQIMLQPNFVTGLLILLGIGIHSLPAAFGGVVGLLFGTATSLIAGYDKEDLVSGLHGYNGVLVGLALFSLYEMSVLLFLLTALGGALSTILFSIMKKREWAPYTFPFVAVTWFFFALLGAVGAPRTLEPVVGNLAAMPFLSGWIRGIGQVMFRPEITTGVVFLIAVLVSSRTAALFAAVGSLVGMVLGQLLGVPIEDLGVGLFGFNAVLCGIAFSGRTLSSFFWALVAMVLATFVYFGFYRWGVPALTFPFVAATWVVSAAKGRFNRIRSSVKRSAPGE